MPGYQQVGVASNPANGINNIPLDGGAEAGDNGGAVNPDELLALLKKIQGAPSEQAGQYQSGVEDFLDRSQNPEIQKRLKQILYALTMTSNPRQTTVDPATGNDDPDAAQIAQKLIREINQMTQTQQKPQKPEDAPDGQQNTGQSGVTADSRALIRWAQRAPKKKTRGNPFRVLMGKVGKLLDHGLEKSTIVREIKKRINFGEDTIARAVDIVKDYNKSKRQKNRAEDSASKKTDTHEEKSPAATRDQKSSVVFNAARWAAKSVPTPADDPGGVYAAKPQFEKRSTAELIARKSWLEDLRDMGKSAADQGDCASELKTIRAALSSRGFSDSEL